MTDGQAPQDKKGLSPIAWIAIGCSGIAVLGAFALLVGGFFAFNKAKDVLGEMNANPAVTAARLIAAANPDIELAQAGIEAGVVTLLNTRTAEEFTIDFEDIEEGKLSFLSNGESVTLELNAGEGDEGGLTIRTNEAPKMKSAMPSFIAW